MDSLSVFQREDNWDERITALTTCAWMSINGFIVDESGISRDVILDRAGEQTCVLTALLLNSSEKAVANLDNLTNLLFVFLSENRSTLEKANSYVMAKSLGWQPDDEMRITAESNSNENAFTYGIALHELLRCALMRFYFLKCSEADRRIIRSSDLDYCFLTSPFLLYFSDFRPTYLGEEYERSIKCTFFEQMLQAGVKSDE